MHDEDVSGTLIIRGGQPAHASSGRLAATHRLVCGQGLSANGDVRAAADHDGRLPSGGENNGAGGGVPAHVGGPPHQQPPGPLDVQFDAAFANDDGAGAAKGVGLPTTAVLNDRERTERVGLGDRERPHAREEYPGHKDGGATYGP
jgi:hypothetical protein